jgi:hypothetical protein
LFKIQLSFQNPGLWWPLVKKKEINFEFMHLLKEAKDFKVSARSSSSTREKETEIGLYQNQPGD